MTDQQRCPLCAEHYAERTDLRIHLEVEHRKSEIVSELIDVRRHLSGEMDEEDDSVAIDGEPQAPRT
ncbi:hypothetical protein [Halopiger xanaduensis]|uniref:C2H2-type domain-containing protein n=1 Tax=Halopiger xanaduensis (strain DSM 18323 / JCM 14033 / SH-6) TaxID=797210 RepID=F8D7R3_HALXS|nr:hypothetical protein [Halopiger xanaduensis]AEH35511.1 hypothetical protein Halxa_0874 [Halopiger xanaduensis SH-6]